MDEGGIITQRHNSQVLSFECERLTDSGYEGVHKFRITVKRSKWDLYDYFLLLIACLFATLSVYDFEGLLRALPTLLLGASFIIWAKSNRVEQEAVVVMPTLGIQLETVYYSKKVHRRFVSLDRIVTPVINEAVTPITCYFYLALILREEQDLLLAFPNLRPPLSMLESIWRSISDTLRMDTFKLLDPGPDWRKERVKDL